MKIKLGTLRRLIREGVISELGISPSLFRNKPISDPMENGNVTKAMGDIERWFNNSLMNTLVLHHADKYNQDTRDFDDATYQTLKDAADSATEEVMSKLNSTLQAAWSKAIKSTSGDKS